MKRKIERTLSRREFAQRAALLSATASLAPSEVLRPAAGSLPPAQSAQSSPRMSGAAQAEADARYQQILTLYSDRLDDAQKANIKRMCAELQPSLERIRSYKLVNGDAPALYLKPLVERQKKPQSSAAQPARRTPALPRSDRRPRSLGSSRCTSPVALRPRVRDRTDPPVEQQERQVPAHEEAEPAAEGQQPVIGDPDQAQGADQAAGKGQVVVGGARAYAAWNIGELGVRGRSLPVLPAWAAGP